LRLKNTARPTKGRKNKRIKRAIRVADSFFVWVILLTSYMGQRQNILKDIICRHWNLYRQPKPSSQDLLSSNYSNYIFKAYQKLTGALELPPTNFGAWDISTHGFIIELDEEQHFNRYRLTTLESNFYKEHRTFTLNDYRRFCENNETVCLKCASRGGYWKNDSTEKQFLQSGLNGVLDGNGSSRWKQRAYYDFLKDISSKIIKVPLIRISIYDTFKGFTVHQLLESNSENLVLELVTERIS
jgi:hypothetical protein